MINVISLRTNYWFIYSSGNISLSGSHTYTCWFVEVVQKHIAAQYSIWKDGKTWTQIFHVHPYLRARLVFYCEKLIFEKVEVTTYFCLFLKGIKSKKIKS